MVFFELPVDKVEKVLYSLKDSWKRLSNLKNNRTGKSMQVRVYLIVACFFFVFFTKL